MGARRSGRFNYYYRCMCEVRFLWILFPRICGNPVGFNHKLSEDQQMEVRCEDHEGM